MAAKRMRFPWRWTSGTISTNMDVIWGMSVEMLDRKTTRRNFLQQTGVWAGAFAVGGALARRAQAAREKELNIYC